MQYEQVCKSCAEGCTKPAMPIEAECVRCGGKNSKDCPACGGTGKWELKECPKKFVTSDVWEAIELAELFAKGLPPVAGGVLDQANSFVEAARFIFAEQAFWKAKLGIF